MFKDFLAIWFSKFEFVRRYIGGTWVKSKWDYENMGWAEFSDEDILGCGGIDIIKEAGHEVVVHEKR